ncbi:hypothetical protein PIPA1_16580 [Pelosinus sp. IPA-1]|nr:hypothetical protein PIPA1_16580 [Pelosinus sp. IPA-1]
MYENYLGFNIHAFFGIVQAVPVSAATPLTVNCESAIFFYIVKQQIREYYTKTILCYDEGAQ